MTCEFLPRGRKKVSTSILFFAILVLATAHAFAESAWVSEPVRSAVSVTSATGTVQIADMRKVAIFPFADYSQVQPYELSPVMGINQRILEEVTDWFVSNGVEVAVQEDVTGLLLTEGAVLVMKQNTEPSTLEWELKNRHHSPLMQKNVANVITDDRIWGSGWGKTDGGKVEGFTAGISREFLKKVGAELGADKVVRGRIIDYAIVKTKSWNPANGVLAVALGGLIEGMGAYAYKESYERGLPPPTVMDNDIYGNRFIKIEAGMEIPPREKMSDVQVRLYLQDVGTGQVLWSNRAHVRFNTDSNLNFPENHPQRMLDAAVKDAVAALMKDLFKK